MEAIYKDLHRKGEEGLSDYDTDLKGYFVLEVEIKNIAKYGFFKE